jgi:hypothetical protein
MGSDATLDLLLDLKHDLGKYLLLPLTLLPRTADEPAVRAALQRALLQTRTRSRASSDAAGEHAGYLSAREVWAGFCSELARAGLGDAALAPLQQVVERALGWEHALADRSAIDRDALERDFRAVQVAIAQLIAEAHDA